MKRLQQALISNDLRRKMVFLTGPRQVGKTSIAKAIAAETSSAVYLNYDSFADRAIIHAQAWLPSTHLLILDELHKMAEWKNYLKGLYDTKPEHLQILVTGSARLETFRQSGDSLAGRFFRHRLNPLSLVEIPDADEAALERLMERGGFPEPYLAEALADANRWRLQYIDGLIRTDILDFEKVHDFKAIQLTLTLLQQRVGSPLSYTSLAQDVGVSPNTIKRYIEIFEALYIIFRVTPCHRNIARSLQKDAKIYFYDTGLVKGDNGIRFENLVAVSLLKHLNAIEDYQGKPTSLSMFRTKEQKEVDFVLLVDDEPVQMVEVKLSDPAVSPNLRYFYEKYGVPAVQLVKNLRQERMDKGIEVRRALDYLKQLAL
ncbi:MAG: ATP-binding protein [Candidatus Thiothrix putei]|uniref:ATP-binding protein n=1 Tax=Candidatus Thiothrix putei TaxID=3080811 RepID=A0AA95HD80_9GAMM|nr:MAG: ATP-binding protein [Candidatus Thiothrix putei]